MDATVGNVLFDFHTEFHGMIGIQECEASKEGVHVVRLRSHYQTYLKTADYLLLLGKNFASNIIDGIRNSNKANTRM